VSDDSNKTEEPTQKRIRDARQKGQVAKSREIPSALSVCGAIVTLWVGWDFFFGRVTQMFDLASGACSLPFEEGFRMAFFGIMTNAAMILGPMILVPALLGVAGHFVQVGFLFSAESVKPDLAKLNPAEGAKKIFSKDNLVEFIKSILKIAFTGTVLAMIFKQFEKDFLKLSWQDTDSLLAFAGYLLKRMTVPVMLMYAAVAAFDYFWQRKSFMSKMRMTKEEVKQEYKEMEGDPLIKSKRRQLHRELAMNAMIEQVKKSTVVVTNPTRKAVALFYDKNGQSLPWVVAKGENLLAKRIIEVAKEAGVPVMENVPLATGLMELDMGRYIPSDLIEPVAEVLKWVESLEHGR
jgi:type III secretion protein U